MSTFFPLRSHSSIFLRVLKLNFELKPVAFETFAYFNFMGHAIVSPIKLQRYRTFERSKFIFKTCRYMAKRCSFACLELLERSLALQLYGTYYSLSHKVETSERSKTQVSIKLVI